MAEASPEDDGNIIHSWIPFQEEASLRAEQSTIAHKDTPKNWVLTQGSAMSFVASIDSMALWNSMFAAPKVSSPAVFSPMLESVPSVMAFLKSQTEAAAAEAAASTAAAAAAAYPCEATNISAVDQNLTMQTNPTMQTNQCMDMDGGTTVPATEATCDPGSKGNRVVDIDLKPKPKPKPKRKRKLHRPKIMKLDSNLKPIPPKTPKQVKPKKQTQNSRKTRETSDAKTSKQVRPTKATPQKGLSSVEKNNSRKTKTAEPETLAVDTIGKTPEPETPKQVVTPYTRRNSRILPTITTSVENDPTYNGSARKSARRALKFHSDSTPKKKLRFSEDTLLPEYFNEELVGLDLVLDLNKEPVGLDLVLDLNKEPVLLDSKLGMGTEPLNKEEGQVIQDVACEEPLALKKVRIPPPLLEWDCGHRPSSKPMQRSLRSFRCLMCDTKSLKLNWSFSMKRSGKPIYSEHIIGNAKRSMLLPSHIQPQRVFHQKYFWCTMTLFSSLSIQKKKRNSRGSLEKKTYLSPEEIQIVDSKRVQSSIFNVAGRTNRSSADKDILIQPLNNGSTNLCVWPDEIANIGKSIQVFDTQKLEKIANSGQGMQLSDAPKLENVNVGQSMQISDTSKQDCSAGNVLFTQPTAKKKRQKKKKPSKIRVKKQASLKCRGLKNHTTIKELMEIITTKFNCLQISDNALILYKEKRISDSALVLYKKNRISDTANKKKKEYRMAVDLDPESERVWILYKEKNDGSDPVQEADREKQEKWKEERRKFRERVNMFTGCMHDILGNRRFTPWKGSVVDSVAGVFLTQNVSDHLSSSAFMAMVSRFPVKLPKDSFEKYTVEFPEECERVSRNDLQSDKSCTIQHNIHDNMVVEKDVGTMDPCKAGVHSPSREIEPPPILGTNKESTSSRRPGYMNMKKKKGIKDDENNFNWDTLRTTYSIQEESRSRSSEAMDSVDWEAVRKTSVEEVANTIAIRGQQNILAEKIKDFLDRTVKDHGSIDLEWLRNVPPEETKKYLLSIYGLGIKSVECLRLLTLHHHAFPVDINVGRIAVRLGWVPLQPLPEGLQIHLLNNYPLMDQIQAHLWPRLCHLDQHTLYELHYHMITFGKVFCTKRSPNCEPCPLKGECRHYASAWASANRALTGPPGETPPKGRKITTSKNSKPTVLSPGSPMLLAPNTDYMFSESWFESQTREPIIEEPPEPLSPETKAGSDMEDEIEKAAPDMEYLFNAVVLSPETKMAAPDMEDLFNPAVPSPTTEKAAPDMEDLFNLVVLSPETEKAASDMEDPFKPEVRCLKGNEEIYTAGRELVLKDPSSSRELVSVSLQSEPIPGPSSSRELVLVSPRSASAPPPKLKQSLRLRTEHQVFVLPDGHPALEGFDRRDPSDPSSYLFAMWPKEKVQNPLTVKGSILIPCRTAMRGSFPLNGTYFQTNEVFADYETSQRPLEIHRTLLWNLPRPLLYCGSSVSAMMKGATIRTIANCFAEGFVCVRAFDRETRAPKTLPFRFHKYDKNNTESPKEKKNLSTKTKKAPSTRIRSTKAKIKKQHEKDL